MIRAPRLLLLALLATVAMGCTIPTSATQPLSMTCPSVPVATSATGAPVVVTFPLPTAKNGSTSQGTTCGPQSGAAFPVGTTTVTCTTAPDATRVSSCSFGVTVRDLPRLAYTRYLSFGDSITAGTISPPITTFAPSLLSTLALQGPDAQMAFLRQTLITDNPAAYPAVLQTRLNTRYPQQRFEVLNDGVGGEFTAPQGEARLPGSLAVNNPQVLLLMEGTNDLLNPTGPDAAIAALDRMIQLTLAQGRRVVLATIAPQRPDGMGSSVRRLTAPRVVPFNDRVRVLAQTRGVPLADVYAAINADLPRLLGVDDLHPTAQGYQVIADTFANTIRVSFEQGGSPAVIPK
jgi:lysophospholipase L1-like esterase